MKKYLTKKYIAIFLILGFLTQCVTLNFDHFNFDKDDKSICVTSIAEIGKANLANLKNAGWQIYDQTYGTGDKKFSKVHMGGDKQCARYSENIRYAVAVDTEEEFSFLGCIHFIGGGSSPTINNKFFVKDLKRDKKVFTWSKSGCDSYYQEFYNVLVSEMLKNNIDG